MPESCNRHIGEMPPVFSKTNAMGCCGAMPIPQWRIVLTTRQRTTPRLTNGDLRFLPAPQLPGTEAALDESTLDRKAVICRRCAGEQEITRTREAPAYLNAPGIPGSMQHLDRRMRLQARSAASRPQSGGKEGMTALSSGLPLGAFSQSILSTDAKTARYHTRNHDSARRIR